MIVVAVTFAQEHELRQVYIRSTARVYEVYYTKKKRDDREYLCTVRCGVAMTEDEEVLKIIPLIESPASENGVVPVKDGNGNARTNEDDWVEVKAGEKDLLSVPQLGQQVTGFLRKYLIEILVCLPCPLSDNWC